MGIDSIFGIGGPEFLFILILAGIFLGPGRIARVARWLGQTTARLQLISRGFMDQLRSELDMADDQDDFRDMLKEMQDLRNEVSQLQNQLGQSLKEATVDTEDALNELKNSIAPPTFEDQAVQNGGAGDDEGETPSIRPPSFDAEPATNGSVNGKLNGSAEKKAAPSLPKPIEVEDDPE